ncbi:hypothetical protein HMPREF9554_01134 [Treponema phagedenis F0421]|nr:hypothetical protein HMPREF9554_01134 [Treponema phagedenis F0421]
MPLIFLFSCFSAADSGVQEKRCCKNLAVNEARNFVSIQGFVSLLYFLS